MKTTCLSCLQTKEIRGSEVGFIGSTSGLICLDCRENVGQCCLCFKEISFSLSNSNCFGLRVCDTCNQEFERIPNEFKESKFSNHSLVQKHQRDYKRFLLGKAYPEITVWHKSESDGVTTTIPIKGKKFFIH